MRERIRRGQQGSQQDFTQMVNSLSKHKGLKAAFKQQIADGLTSWHDSLNKLFTSCPFLTRLDLSKCAAIVSERDYSQLALQTYNSNAEYWLAGGKADSAKAAAAEASRMVHPCTSAVTKQQALPISIKRLLPMLESLSCLQALHLCLTKISKDSIQLIAWAFKVEWQRKNFSLPELHISFAHPGEQFLGYPTLPIMTDDIIELTIYSDITHVDITNHNEIHDMSIAALSLLPNLKTVWASGGTVSNLGLIMICSAQTITKLDLSKCVNVTNSGVSGLTRLQRLQSLDLSDCNNLGDDSLQALLPGLPHLHTLTLQHCTHVTDAGITGISQSSQLTSLNLALCREITDTGVASVAALPLLHTLDLTFCDRITDASVHHLHQLPGLQNLGMACCKLSSSGVGALGSLEGLTCLDLVGCVDGVTPDAMRLLSQAPRLKSLNLAFCSLLSDAGVQALSRLTTLSNLNLAYCKWLSNDGILTTSTLTALTSLNLQGCCQTAPHLDMGLAALHCMPYLVHLSLGSCKLAPGAITHLSALTQLLELSLRFCKGVVPPDLIALKTMRRLKHLDLSGVVACTNSSLSNVSGLRYLQKLHIGFNRQLTGKGLAHLTQLSHLTHLAVNSCPLVREAALESLLAALPSLTKMTTNESQDADQSLLLHTKNVSSCYASLPLPDVEQEIMMHGQ
ncbi:hypothetical protein ABBQ38_001994 [Trebouxia sp. C0009 RCD-2024]